MPTYLQFKSTNKIPCKDPNGLKFDSCAEMGTMIPARDSLR